jgi:ABC-type arginine transport system permease subunit
VLVGLKTFLRKADAAVQDTKESVTATAVVAAAALVVAVVALIVVVVKS